MTTRYGALGQGAPGAAALTDLYQVPVAHHATVKVIACNRSTATTVRISLAPTGAADADAHYLIYDLALDANASQSTAPVTCGETDVIRGWSASGSVSFTVTGIEADD
jgi:hypothetical protein